MAKKARKAAAKRGKKTVKTSKMTKKAGTAKKAKAAKKKTRRKAKPSIRERIASGFKTVVDTVTGTEKLREKLEPRGSDETE